MIIRRVIQVLIIMLFILGSTFDFEFVSASQPDDVVSEAVEEQNIAVHEEDTVIYSFDQVVKRALSHNVLIQSLQQTIETKQVQVQEKQSAANRLSDSDVKNLELAKLKYYGPFQAEIEKKISELTKQEKENEISLAAINGYLDMLYAKQAVPVLESGINRANEQVKIAQLRFDVGQGNKVDVLSAEVQLSKAESERDQMENQLMIQKMKLNQIMNRPLDAPLDIEPIDMMSVESIPFTDEDIKEGLNYNLSIRSGRLEWEGLNMLVEIIDDYFPTNTYMYRSADSQRKTKESIIKETSTKTELAIRSQQSRIDSLKKIHGVMEKQLEKVETTYEMMWEQYKAGLISYQDLADADQLLKQTAIDELKARFDYMRAVYDYRYLIGDIPVDKEVNQR